MCIDDNDLHLNMIKMSLQTSLGANAEIVEVANNGKIATEKYFKLLANHQSIDVITMDIRMPIIDGLSAAVKIKRKNPSQKIVMVSSEDERTVKNGKVQKVSEEEKIVLINKVIDKVKFDIVEDGKINFILDACDLLQVNPIQVAKMIGANGYLHKPYKVDEVKECLSTITSGATYFKM